MSIVHSVASFGHKQAHSPLKGYDIFQIFCERVRHVSFCLGGDLLVGGVEGEQGNVGWFHHISQKSNVMHLAQLFLT